MRTFSQTVLALAACFLMVVGLAISSLVYGQETYWSLEEALKRPNRAQELMLVFPRELSELPPEIGRLTNLQELLVRDQGLGELPPEIGRLTNLEVLWLDGNNLSELPTEFSQLTNLRRLLLSDNEFTELPAVIASLENLESLYIAGNDISNLPAWIGDLTKLDYLSFRDNRLTELPLSIVKLVNLEILDLENNQLTELPSEIGQLTRLQVLNLAGNQLTELPPELAGIADRSGEFLGRRETVENGINRIYGSVNGRPLIRTVAMITADLASAVQRAERLVDIIESLEAGEAPTEPIPEPEDFSSTAQSLGEYLDANPDDVAALILFAQLGRVIELSVPVVIAGGEVSSDEGQYAASHAALDRALILEPNNPEAHYWLARLYGITEPTINDDGLLIKPQRDLSRAIFHADRAVELAPTERGYREALAIYLAHAQRYDDAIEVLREVDAGEHLIYRILSDLQTIPLPENARYLPLDSASLAELQMSRGRYENYPDLRVRVYSVPGPASVFEDAFRQQWPDFELYEAESSEVGEGTEITMFMQSLRWRNDGLQPVTTRVLSRAARRGREPADSIVIISVTEILNPTEEGQERWQLATADRISLLSLMNTRHSVD